MSVRSGDSVSMASWDDCSVASSVGGGGGYTGGVQQRVASAGLRQLPVVPPIGSASAQVAPPLATVGGGQWMGVPMSEYNQFKAYQAAMAYGARGRGQGGRGGGRQLPPLQHPNQN